MTRGARVAGIIAALIAVQLGAVLVYRAVERSRSPRPAGEVTRFVHERLDGGERAVTIDAARPDGSAAPLTWPAERVRLVHFWATWCEPCKRELPGLLAFSRGLADRSPGVELIAVAIDDDWRDIAAFFDEVAATAGASGGRIPDEVRLAPDAAAAKRFGVSTLPDSYLVAPDGALRERYHGARDWGSPAARAHLLDALAATPR